MFVLVQASGLLQQPHKTEEDLENLQDTCFLLNSLQVHKLLTNFRDDMDQPISKEILKSVYDRTLESKDDVLLEKGRHAPFTQPPFKILERLESNIPASMKGDELLAQLTEDKK